MGSAYPDQSLEALRPAATSIFRILTLVGGGGGQMLLWQPA